MTTFIDDHDPDKVHFHGTWWRGGTEQDYKGTVASSTQVGDYFTVTFRGTNIAVFGTFDITSGGVVTAYSVDGAPPAQVTSQAGSRDTGKQQFWRSAELSMDTHELMVNMTKINSDPQPGEGTIWFDCFLVTTPTTTSESLDSSPPSSLSAIHKRVPVEAIVGGVIGGLFFLLGLVFLFFLYRRRMQYLSAKGEKADNGLLAGHRTQLRVEPFVLPGPINGHGTLATKTIEEFDPRSLVSGPAPMVKRLLHTNRRPGTHSTFPTNHDASTEDIINIALANSNSCSTSLAARILDNIVEPGTRIHLNAATNSPSQLSPTFATENPVPRSLRHVDSGVRILELAASDVDTATRIELPPIYSAM